MSEENKSWDEMTDLEKRAHLDKKISKLQDNLENPNLSNEAKNQSASLIAGYKWRKEHLDEK